MGEISGVSTDDINNVDGFFTSQSGGGGGTATTTPTISVTEGVFGKTTVQVTNHSSFTNPNYQCSAAVGATTTVADTSVAHTLESNADHLSDTMTFTDTNSASGTRTLTVKAQDFGNTIQSAAVTATYNVGGIPSSRYIRIRATTSTGANDNQRIGIWNCRLYESAGQTGTSHPTNMSSATTDTNGDNFYTISAGHNYGTYYPYKAFDSSSSIYAMWWSLGTSAANNWIQIKFDDTEFSTPPEILSMKFAFNDNATFADFFAIETSDNGSSFTQRGVFPITNGTNNIQNYP